MKILVVSQYFYPENFQINEICSDLVNRGHQVTVLTGLPNYPLGTIPKEYRYGRRRNEYINGVHVLRCPEIGRKKGVIRLTFNYLSYSCSASLRALCNKFDFDVIYVYELSPILMVMPAAVLKRKYKKPMFLYCCDLWPESMKLLLKKDNGLVFRIVSRISTSLYKKSDKIAVQSESFIPYFESQHGISEDNICYIPQFADDSYLDMDFSEDHPGTNFVFLGNIGVAQNMECILKAIKLIDQEKFKVHIVGDGSFLDECKRLVDEYDISDKVVFYGRRPVGEMPNFYKMADACLLTLKDNLAVGNTIPSKLQGYMAAGKTVLGAINGSAQDIIIESNCGLCVDANDSDGLAHIMLEFIENKDKYIEYGKNGRDYFSKHFTQEIHVNSVEKELIDLAGGK